MRRARKSATQMTSGGGHPKHFRRAMQFNQSNSINQSRTKTEQNAMNVKGRIASTTARTCQPWGAILIRLGRIVW